MHCIPLHVSSSSASPPRKHECTFTFVHLSLTDSVACSSKAASWCDYYDLFFSYTSSPSLVDSWLANEMQINVSPALLFVPQSAAHLIKRLKLLDIQEWRFCCFCRHPGEYSGRTCRLLPVEMESSCCCSSSRRQRRRECCVCQFWGETLLVIHVV